MRKRIIIHSTLVFYCLFGVVNIAKAVTYYVSPTGTAGWAACVSINTPCAPEIAMQNAVAGDVVYFRGGDYFPPDAPTNPGISWRPSNKGTSGSPIIFAAYSGEAARIYQPTGSNSAAAMGVSQTSSYQSNSYVVFDGFTFIKRRHLGAGGTWKCELGSNITVKNNTFIGNEPWQTTTITGVINSPDRIGYSRVAIVDAINSAAATGQKIFVTITGTTDYNGSFTDFNSSGNKVYYVDETHIDIQRAYTTSQIGSIVISDAQNQVGLYNTDCTDLEITNNIFKDFSYDTVTSPNQGYGQTNGGAMYLLGGLRTVVHGNTFLDMPHAVQTKGSADGITSYNNFFYGVKVPFHWVQQWSGIKDFLIYNNIAVLPSSGIFVDGIGAVSWANNLIYNNTIYCQGDCTGVLQPSNMLEVRFFNNILYGASGITTFLRYDTGVNAPIYSDYNNYYTQGTANWRMAVSPGAYSTNTYTSLGAWNAASGLDMNSAIANPNFVNPGGNTAADYKRTSYPTNGRGGSYASIMGAYITGNETIGYVAQTTIDNTPPAVPTGLGIN